MPSQIIYFPYMFIRCAGVSSSEFLKQLKTVSTNDSANYFQSVIEENRAVLQRFSQQQDFQISLLFSSHTLFEALEKFQKTPPDSFKKKHRQIERKLCQYLTRMSTKIAPFASFGNVGFWNVATKQMEQPINGKYALQRNVQYESFLATNTENEAQNWRLNPTLSQEKKTLKFFFNSANIESIQRVQSNAVLIKLETFFHQQKQATISELQSYFLANFNTAFNDTTSRYFIKQLIEIGLLLPQNVLPNKPLNLDCNIKNINNLQIELADTANAIRRNEVSEKKKNYFTKVKTDNHFWQPEQTLWLDSFQIKEIDNFPQEILQKSATFANHILKYIEQHLEHTPCQNLTQLFIENFSSKKTVSLLDFYELSVQHFNRWTDENITFSGTNNITKIIEKQTTDFQATLRGALFQIIGERQLFWQATLDGYGQLFSRYLDLYNDNLKDDIIQLIKCDDILLATVHDASISNIQGFSTIAQYIIDATGTLQMPNVIGLQDIFCKYNKTSNRVELWDKNSVTKIKIINTSLENIRNRSNMFQFLLALQDTAFSHKILFQNDTGKMVHVGVHFFDRITFQDFLVLRRAKWRIDQQALPVLSKLNDNFEDFIVINKWLNSLKLPTKFYVRLDTNRFENDNYKPQYIDANVPNLVQLFEKLIRQTTDFLIIEEAIPAPEDYPLIEKKPIKSEVAIFWKTKL